MGPVTITRRIDPCGCGCQGGDPWHQREFTRTLHDVRQEAGSCVVHAYGAQVVAYRATAWARLPWGEGKLVRVVEVVLEAGGRQASLGWFSTRDVAP